MYKLKYQDATKTASIDPKTLPTPDILRKP